MAYKVVVTKPVSQKIGQCGLSRPALVRALNKLYQELEDNADKHRPRRTPGRQEESFILQVVIRDGERMHRLIFYIDDRTAGPDRLIVEDVSHSFLDL